MKATSWYECSRGCEYRAPFTGIVYRCHGCDGLLDAEPNLEALKARPADAWKALFADRAASFEWPYSSGVWSKHEWIHPFVEKEHIVSLGEGNTPLLRVPRLGKTLNIPDLWFKQCWLSSTGSFADLGMTVFVSAINQKIKYGEPIRAVGCASLGDMSAALAVYCAAAGIPAIVFLPREEGSPGELAQPLACGAWVFALDSDLDGCRQIVRQVARDRSIYIADLMDSLCIEGQKTVAVELTQQLGWSVPDWVILPSKDPGGVTALARGFLMMRALGLVDRLPRIACAQTQSTNSSDQYYQSGFVHYELCMKKEKVTTIQIAVPGAYERAAKLLCAFAGIVEEVSQDDLVTVATQADRAGLWCSPSTKVALAALSKLCDRGEIHSTDRVVVFSTPQKLTCTPDKVGHREKVRKDGRPYGSNRLVELPADPGIVAERITDVLAQSEIVTRHKGRG